MKIFIVLIALLCIINQTNAYCQRGEACWPTKEDLDTLMKNMDPQFDRDALFYTQQEKHMSVPVHSKNDQPLYGNNVELDPVYEQSDYVRKCGVCNVQKGFTKLDDPNFQPVFCMQSVRQSPPANGSEPAFLAWPVNKYQVVELIQFANKHDLCVSVAGSGRDVMSRDVSVGCENGIFIRTALLKDQQLNKEVGLAVIGAGVTFSEFYGQNKGVYTASSWYQTDSVVSWLLNGGGYGPMANYLGLGIDQIDWLEIVLANATIVTVDMADELTYTNLAYALRGGGGSTWGVVTSVQMKVYTNPEGGFTYKKMHWKDNFDIDKADQGLQVFNKIVPTYFAWALGLTNKWSGGLYATTYQLNSTDKPANQTSKADFELKLAYLYLGSNTEEEYTATWKSLTTDLAGTGYDEHTDSFTDFYDFYKLFPINKIDPANTYPNGAPSVLVNRTEVAKQDSTGFVAYTLARMYSCEDDVDLCGDFMFFHSVGDGSLYKKDVEVMAATKGLRNAMYHVVQYPSNRSLGFEVFTKYYEYGESSYFGESELTMKDYKTRYWADPQYLEDIKTEMDIHNRFFCHRCIGFDNVKVNYKWTVPSSFDEANADLCTPHVPVVPPNVTPVTPNGTIPDNGHHGDGSHTFLWFTLILLGLVLLVVLLYCVRRSYIRNSERRDSLVENLDGVNNQFINNNIETSGDYAPQVDQ